VARAGSSFTRKAAAAEAKGAPEEDYKGESKFATHLKANTSQSVFAKTRTLKQQREYLPAFACREELMKTIRENQGARPRPVCYVQAG
jgi:pre-mRNA-splicing factor ATP-dependent RNA helicase DHX38/PRP16